MPTLEFKGKQFVHSHHLSVPFRQLVVDKDKSLSDKPDLDDNLIIHGDNLHALKALLPQYAGKVKCIYIDPPYNTGNEGWCYNDKVNSPLIKEWLKKSANPVDKDDLERHDKWLCMIWPRLKLLYELLSEDGLLFVSISDIELHHLYAILFDIFGEHSFSTKFIWVNEGNIDNQSRIKQNHEYVIMFCKNDDEFDFPPVIDPNIGDDSKLFKGEISNTIVKNGIKNPVSDLVLPKGFPADFDEGEISPNVKWPKFDGSMKVSKGKLCHRAVVKSGWSSKALCEDFIQNNFSPVLDKKGQKTRFVLTETGAVYVKKDRSDKQSHVLTVLRGMGTVQEMSAQLEQVGIDFTYPKPVDLVKYLISMMDDKDGFVLDSFAGSGTTAHAVLALNKEDGGNRKFILVECEDYADEITAERVRRVIKGVAEAEDEALREGLGGSFTFCELGDEINIESLLKGDNLPDYESLARYVFYTATGKTLESVAKASGDYYIGETDLYRVHLIYQPSRDFMRSNESALNADMVERIAESNTSGKRCLVFASAKYMSQKELTGKKIDFCQLPYAIHRVLGD